jgi:hypothetical protein
VEASSSKPGDGGDSPCSTRSPVDTQDTGETATECDSPHRVPHRRRANGPGGSSYSPSNSSLADSDLPVDAFNVHRGRAQHSHVQGGGSSSSGGGGGGSRGRPPQPPTSGPWRRADGSGQDIDESLEEGRQRGALYRGVPGGPPLPPGSQRSRGRGAGPSGHRRHSREGAPAVRRSLARGGASGSGSRSSVGLDELLEGEEERVEEGRYPPRLPQGRARPVEGRAGPPSPPAGRGAEGQPSSALGPGVEHRPDPLSGDAVREFVQEGRHNPALAEGRPDPRRRSSPPKVLRHPPPVGDRHGLEEVGDDPRLLAQLASPLPKMFGPPAHAGDRMTARVSDCEVLHDDYPQQLIGSHPRMFGPAPGSGPRRSDVSSVSDEELLEEGLASARGAVQEPARVGTHGGTLTGGRAQHPRPVRDTAPPHRGQVGESTDGNGQTPSSAPGTGPRGHGRRG